MLISGVLLIMSLYRLPHRQYAYSGHVINLPQDVASFANSFKSHTSNPSTFLFVAMPEYLHFTHDQIIM